MHVRRFQGRDDVAGIVRLHTRAWREAYDGLLPDSVLADLPDEPTEDVVDRWLEGLRQNADGVLVAVEADGGDGGDRHGDGREERGGDRVLGFADVRWGDAETKPFVRDDEAGLKAIYVDPDHWGRGVGTALLERGVDLLPADVGALRLEVLAGNHAARRFYEARGFERTGTSETDIGGESYESVVYALEV